MWREAPAGAAAQPPSSSGAWRLQSKTGFPEEVLSPHGRAAFPTLTPQSRPADLKLGQAHWNPGQFQEPFWTGRDSAQLGHPRSVGTKLRDAGRWVQPWYLGTQHQPEGQGLLRGWAGPRVDAVTCSWGSLLLCADHAVQKSRFLPSVESGAPHIGRDPDD